MTFRNLEGRVSALEVKHSPKNSLLANWTDEKLIEEARKIFVSRGYPEAASMSTEEMVSLARQELAKL